MHNRIIAASSMVASPSHLIPRYGSDAVKSIAPFSITIMEKIMNQSNLKRSARRCEISGPLQLSLKEVRDNLQVAHNKCKYFRKNSYCYRRKHLNNRLLRSQQLKDEESENKTSAIIQRDKDRSEWRRRNNTMEKPMDRSARIVQASTEDGVIVEFTRQDKVGNDILDIIHKKRFQLAEQAPICQGKL